MTTNPLHVEIRKNVSSNNHSKVLSYCDRALTKDSNDCFASYCKLIALTKLEKFDEILAYVKKSPQLNDDVYFIKAYAEYRLNKLQNAISTLDKANQEDLRVKELLAQIHFKQENFEEAMNNLISVAKNSTDDFSDERNANIIACSNFQGSNFEPEESDELFESYFNKATHELNKGNISKALSLLEKAEQLCRDSFGDGEDCNEEDILEEVAPILVQKAYIWQKYFPEKEPEALKILHDVSKISSQNPVLQAVVSNNIVCINREQNIFESRRRMKNLDSVTTSTLQHKLLKQQIFTMGYNQALFYWKTQQIELVKTKVKSLLKNMANLNERDAENLAKTKILITLLSLCVMIYEKQLADAQKELEAVIESVDKNEKSLDHKTQLFLSLVAIQLKILPNNQAHRILEPGQPIVALNTQGMLVEMSRTLEKYLSLERSENCSPFVIGLWLAGLHGELVAAKSSQDQTSIRSRIKSVIDKVMVHHQDLEDDTSRMVLTNCGDFLSRSCMFKEASSIYENILNNGASIDEEYRSSILAKLISSLARFDSKRAEEYSAKLQFNDLLSDREVDTLETAFLFGAKYVKRLDRHGKKITDKSTSDVVDIKNKQKKKKKRKTKLPKSYVPGTVPDPERWIPRRERAGYRNKKRSDRKNPLKGPQGQTTGAAEWDVNVRKSTATASSQPVDNLKTPRSMQKKTKKRR